MSFVAKIFVNHDEVGPGCGPFDLYSVTDNTGIYGQNCSASEISTTPFLVDVPRGDGITGLTASTGYTFTAPSPLTKKIQIRFKGVCIDNPPLSICIIGIPTPTPTPTPSPTPTATPTATPTLTPTPPPTNTPTPTPTPSPTPTPTPGCDFNGSAVYGNTLPTPTPNPTSTPTVTPTATPTVTPDPTPTPFETTFSGYVSLNNGPSACSGGEYAAVNVTVRGTSLCTLTKVLGLSSPTYGNVYGDMTNDDTFWVSNGTDEREFKRDGSAQTGTAQTSCTSCSNPPTPTPGPTVTPIPESYYDYVRCTGPTSGVSPIYSVALSGSAPSGITIEGNCFSPLNGIQYTSPANYEIKTYTGTGCACD
jgi:hypothetical protein